MKIYIFVIFVFGVFNASHANKAVHLRTGVILDKSSQSIVVMQPEGGITSYDLQSGEKKWSSTNSDMPLSIQSGQVLSQKRVHKKGLLTLTFQSITDGLLLNTVNLDLPQDVMANVVNGPTSIFNISSNNTRASNELEWTFRAEDLKGTAPSLQTLLSKSKHKSTVNSLKRGLINLDFNNKAATTITTNNAQTAVKKDIEKNILEGVMGRQFLSQDGQHVLVSKKIKNNKVIQYNWHIYSLNAKLLGSLKTDNSYTPFVVADNILFFISTETGGFENNQLTKNHPILNAFNLQTQHTVWTNTIGSTKYFGQLPH